MNSLIETLNEWGGYFLDFAWPMAWQAGLLITALLAFDFLFRRRVRASVRYALWLVVLVKLMVPPTLALPTSPAWWLHTNASPMPIMPKIQNYTVSYDQASLSPALLNALPAFIPPPPVMTWAAWLLVLSAVVSVVLLVWLLVRWWQITRQVSVAWSSSRLTALMAKTQLLAGVRGQPPVKLTGNTMSPAVCGLFRPAILIPQALVEQFSDEQLRAVLLHELIHLQRRDVWLNFVQSLLQIVYWWHPLVWLANARIRRIREEAVDDAVMLALAGESEAYAPTLLEVAKLALNRPLASLGLVGILESRSALRQRIERLVDFRAPRRAGLTLVSVFGVLAFTAVAVPMGGAPGVEEVQAPEISGIAAPAMPVSKTNTSVILVTSYFYRMPEGAFETTVSNLKFKPGETTNDPYWVASPENFSQLIKNLNSSVQQLYFAPIVTASGIEVATHIDDIDDETNRGSGLAIRPVIEGESVDMTIIGDVVQKSDGILVTNRFATRASMKDSSGVVIHPNGNGNNLLVVIGVQIVTNQAKPSADYKVKAASLVQDAKLDYEMGKLDESEASLNSALALNPHNAAAKYYLELINETRQYRQDGAQSVPERTKFIEIINHTRLDQFVTKKRMPLEDVLSQLSRQAQQANPDMQSVNIITSFPADDPSAETNSISIGSMKFHSGFVTNDQSSAGEDIVVGTMNLKRMTLAQALDAITMMASKPIKYTIMDNDIVFSAVDPQPLYSQIFQLDPDTFTVNLRKQVRLGANPSSSDILAACKILFAKSGVDWGAPKGKLLFYKDRTKTLYVKATQDDLNTIDRAIAVSNIGIMTNENIKTALQIMANENFKIALQALEQRKSSEELAEPAAVTITGRQPDLNVIDRATGTIHESPSQIHVKARFLEVPEGTLSGLINDFDVTRPPDEFTHQPGQYTGITTNENFKIALQALEQRKSSEELAEPEVVTVTGRQPDLNVIDRATGTIHEPPPQVHIKARFIEAPKGILAGLKKIIAIPHQPNQSTGLVGILTSENFKTALQSVEQLKDAEELAEPGAVTLSGRQTDLRATKVITVITNLSFPHKGPLAVIPQSTQIETGPVLDTVPYVLSDGYTINLTADALLTRFLGYNPPPNKPVADSPSVGQVSGVPVFPGFQILQSNDHLNLWDGQTMVMKIKDPAHIYSNVPILGDVPLIGNLFQNQRKTEPEKELIVFVTVTIVDAAGNRVHSEDELPFAANGIPPQN